MNRRSVAEHNALASVLDTMPPTRLTAGFTPLPEQDDAPQDDAPQDDGPDPIVFPVMARDAFPELVRDVVTIATHSSEAHPVAVAANVIALFCCAIGRTAFQRIGDSAIHARPFLLVVGKSGKARKGTGHAGAAGGVGCSSTNTASSGKGGNPAVSLVGGMVSSTDARALCSATLRRFMRTPPRAC